jgi:transposase InsO family protein
VFFRCSSGVLQVFFRCSSGVLQVFFRCSSGVLQVFFTLADVRDKLEHWRQDYNQVRPHSALADHPPETFAAQGAETAAPGPEPVPAPTGKPATGKLLEILN